MVFKKNLMLKAFYFINFTILLLSGCTYQYNASVDLDRVNVDKVNLKVKTFEVNTALKKLFSDAGMILVDYKLEFGDYKGNLLLGDEFTPDGCRVWDKETREKLDKDRFRQGLGDVVESYQIMAKRLGVI